MYSVLRWRLQVSNLGPIMGAYRYCTLGEGCGYLACQDDHVVRHRCCRLGCQPEVDTFELNAFCL